MRHRPPRVVTILAGGMKSDFSPASFTTMDGQQLSTQAAGSEATASASQVDAHPGEAHSSAGAAGVAAALISGVGWPAST